MAGPELPERPESIRFHSEEAAPGVSSIGKLML